MTYIGFLTADIAGTSDYIERTQFLENQTLCLVFKTSFQTKEDIRSISNVLDNHSEILCWSLDLENWEKVLRIVCPIKHRKKVLDLVHKNCSGIVELH